MEVYLARQPIFDTRQEVVAYELLYRGEGGAKAAVANPEAATGEVLRNSFVDIGLERVTNRQRAFINFSRPYLTGELIIPLSPEYLTIEVLETVTPDAEVLRGLRRLSGEGYQIALDDFVLAENNGPLVELADVVKLDVQMLDENRLRAHVAYLRDRGVRLLAEKVETREEFERCRDLGFDLFQGFFFCRPTLVKGRQARGSQMATLRLLKQLNDPNASLPELAETISIDANLVFNLLRYINSAFFALRQEVTSIQNALMLLGMDNVRRWVNLIVLASATDANEELLVTTLARARMCELLAERIGGGVAPASAFLAGLFYSAEGLIGMSLREVLESVHLADSVRQGILEQSGPVGTILKVAVGAEHGNWDEAEKLGLGAELMTDIYLQSLDMAQQAFQAME